MGLLKALKADHATRHIPVIMISGLKRSNAEKLEVQRVGAEGFFPKFDLMAQRGNLLELLRGAVAKNTSPAQWRLLVIEDDIGVQSLIRFALEGLEFEIHFSIAGRDSSRLALDLKPNLILLDMGLPDINGIEVCKTLRENNETKGIPILAMSGIDRTAGVLESSIKALGIEDFLPKPFEDSELLLRISQLLGRVHLERSIGDLLVRGKVRIDVDRRCVWVGERQVESISPKLFDLLQVLMKNTDGVSRQKLRSLLWSDAKNSNVADVTVCRLRKLLGFGEKEGILATPDGYKLVG